MACFVPTGIAGFGVILQHERGIKEDQSCNIIGSLRRCVRSHEAALTFAEQEQCVRIDPRLILELVQDDIKGFRLRQRGCAEHAARIWIAEVERVSGIAVLRELFCDPPREVMIVPSEAVRQNDGRILLLFLRRQAEYALDALSAALKPKRLGADGVCVRAAIIRARDEERRQ